MFRDETGKQIQLGDYFGKRPIVLMLGYYGCPMLCTLVLNGTVDSLQDLKWSVGENFDVIDVSIDPNETPHSPPKRKKLTCAVMVAAIADGWHFLTGDENAIQKLADEVGFHFA